eukprot:1137256-Pelagomonas_calceolata.AAC.2
MNIPQFNLKLCLDNQQGSKLARELHARSVMYACKLPVVITRRVIENKDPLTARFWSRVLPSTPQIATRPLFLFVVEGTYGPMCLSSQCVSFSSIDVGGVPSA